MTTPSGWREFRKPLVAVFVMSALFGRGYGVEPPTLEALKVEGARQSRYISQDETPVDPLEPTADLAAYRDRVAPVLEGTCVQCHGPEKDKGGFRVDTLDPDLFEGSDVAWWLEVLGVLSNGEMPPPDEVEMSDADRSVIVEWLSAELQAASKAQRADSDRTSFRRMTRYEYNYALRDLLGVDWEFARDLPPDARSEDGFRNSSENLHMTAPQLEVYRQTASQALERVTVQGERPETLHWGVTMDMAGAVDWRKQEERIREVREKNAGDPEALAHALKALEKDLKKSHGRPYYKNRANGRTAVATWNYRGARHAIEPSESRREIPESFEHVAILPPSRRDGLIVELGNRVPDTGILRVRALAARVADEDAPIPSMRLEFAWRASNEGRAVIRVSDEDTRVDATPESPKFYEWEVPLGDIYPRNSVRHSSPMGAMPNPSEYIRFVNSSASDAAIQIEYVEVITPYFEQWPPAPHQGLIGEREAGVTELEHARAILGRLMPRAWRRAVSDSEIERKVELFETLREMSDSFEDAMIETLATVLASPNFIYLLNQPESTSSGRLTPHELATRLSIFLWQSVPDEELLRLAREGRLMEPAVLERQVERMLVDDRAIRFSRHFVEQWLDLEILEFLKLESHFPKFDPLLKEAMQAEPIAFFHELLQTDDSVLNLIHADFSVINERLARHYGIEDVHGNQFRRVALRQGAETRGGLMTQAGLLTMNSDGEDSHPLKRGIWLLESLLNDPPPPPPPAVPEIDVADPKIAEMTLKERLEDHRNQAACNSCHSKIDPWGIAFENFDALGRWREEVKNRPVDASSRLFNGREIDGIRGLKRYLLEDRQDQFVSALVHKMMTFALGRPLAFADRSSLEDIIGSIRQNGDGLATVVREIVTSPMFLAR